mmetsp:Transcript_17548/g.37774  ORF Transcript_17548/g.37774 Transcript_17548/m.37774 type:complete len:238 (-) Transcript_17548:158-871(-)
MSAAICARKLELARRRPAAKAPAVFVRPSCWKSVAMPTVTMAMRAANASGAPDDATYSKAARTTVRPRSSNAPNARPTLPSSSSSADGSCTPLPTTSGSSTRIGPTAMSCSSKTEEVAAPDGLSSQPLSLTMGSANAEEEMAPARPSTSASGGLEMSMPPSKASGMSCPIACGAPSSSVHASRAAETKSWSAPRGRNLRSSAKRSPLTSSPSLKSRKTIPMSPSSKSASEFAKRFKP